MRRYATPICRVEGLPEMKAALDQELARVRRALGLKEDDRAIFERHLALYIMAAYFEKPPAERDREVLEGRRVMDERRRSPRPVYWDVEAGADAGPARTGSGRSPRQPRIGDDGGADRKPRTA